MKINISKTWLSSLEIMTKYPVVLLPFMVVAFLEGLVLEMLYFSTRTPLSYVLGPIINKFFGRGYLHYPAHLVLLPKVFYYAQVFVYVVLGIFLSSMTVGIFKKVMEGGTLKPRPIIKTAVNRYGAFLLFGILAVILVALTQKFDAYVFGKIAPLIARHFRDIPILFYSGTYLIGNFITYVILQVLLVLVVPVMVLEKRSFIASLFRGVYLGIRNFFGIFAIIILPYLVYLPLIAVKSEPVRLINNTFPEITVVITAIGIIASPFLECFIILCASGVLMDNEKNAVIST